MLTAIVAVVSASLFLALVRVLVEMGVVGVIIVVSVFVTLNLLLLATLRRFLPSCTVAIGICYYDN